MNLDMAQFGATQNQKQTHARTLLWDKYKQIQLYIAGTRVRLSEHKAMGRFITMKMTLISPGFPD